MEETMPVSPNDAGSKYIPDKIIDEDKIVAISMIVELDEILLKKEPNFKHYVCELSGNAADHLLDSKISTSIKRIVREAFVNAGWKRISIRRVPISCFGEGMAGKSRRAEVHFWR